MHHGQDPPRSRSGSAVVDHVREATRPAASDIEPDRREQLRASAQPDRGRRRPDRRSRPPPARITAVRTRSRPTAGLPRPRAGRQRGESSRASPAWPSPTSQGIPPPGSASAAARAPLQFAEVPIRDARGRHLRRRFCPRSGRSTRSARRRSGSRYRSCCKATASMLAPMTDRRLVPIDLTAPAPSPARTGREAHSRGHGGGSRGRAVMGAGRDRAGRGGGSGSRRWTRKVWTRETTRARRSVAAGLRLGPARDGSRRSPSRSASAVAGARFVQLDPAKDTAETLHEGPPGRHCSGR